MRISISAIVVTLLLASGPAFAFGGAVSFPTLTWPATTTDQTTGTAPSQPAVDCTAPAAADPARCPAPSR